ncbi:hypothetical protein [Mucilaginibacter myungsuensis]|uniref:Uncharacterized protein n=1 Tax=Mucilaginibacter myungsuensis TaxID=649104 RepID=A0A929KVP9_9SPHI|nr:hypothetical protein [Mucilaginibacter myungsuensis]MBE9662022.1 hypothetical protein [Mucilaginibacter myungsuensis]MDN3599545.1 hypothetical protein [Mucilaginibacter myungsuensis]
MAQFTFTNNTYAGEALAGFMASTLLEADSVKRGLLTVINDVKSRKVILDVDDDVKLQDPSGIFTDQGTTAHQTESYLDPVVYEFMKQEQWDKLAQSWEAQALAPGAFGDYEGVVDLSDFMVQRYLTKIQIANERLYWLGKAATKEASFTAQFDGLLPSIANATGTYKVGLGKSATSMSATAINGSGVVTVASTATLSDGDVVTITAVTGNSKDITNGGAGIDIQGQSYFIQVLTATTFKLVRNYNEINTRKAAQFTGTSSGATISYINASNVLGVLSSVFSQLDPADRSQDDFNLQIPLHVGYAYAQAQASQATNVLNAFTDKKKMDYLGIPLQLMNHWQANTILGARSSNLFLGVDLLGDASELSTVYMKPYTNDNVVRMKARMKAAVNFKFANELFLLTA